MKVILVGFGVMVGSACLAYYNVSKNDKKEITGPTLTLIFSSFVGFALLIGLPFQLLGFDSAKLTTELSQKVAQADDAKVKAEKAQLLAERALEKSREVYAIGLVRTGMLPSEASTKKDQIEAREILKEVYKDDYSRKMKNLIDQHVLPRGFEP